MGPTRGASFQNDRGAYLMAMTDYAAAYRRYPPRLHEAPKQIDGGKIDTISVAMEKFLADIAWKATREWRSRSRK